MSWLNTVNSMHSIMLSRVTASHSGIEGTTYPRRRNRLPLLGSLLALFTLLALPGCTGIPGDNRYIGRHRNDPAGFSVVTPIECSTLPSGLTNVIPNKDVLDRLPNETVAVTILQYDKSGRGSYSGSGLTSSGSTYRVVIDYTKYATRVSKLPHTSRPDLPYFDFSIGFLANRRRAIEDALYLHDQVMKRGQQLGKQASTNQVAVSYHIGVGLRVNAMITARASNIDLGSLFSIGLAAESKKIFGTLAVQTIGISGRSVSPSVPMPSEINTTTIQNAMTAIATMKSRMYDSDVMIVPHVFCSRIGGSYTRRSSLLLPPERKPAQLG